MPVVIWLEAVCYKRQKVKSLKMLATLEYVIFDSRGPSSLREICNTRQDAMLTYHVQLAKMSNEPEFKRTFITLFFKCILTLVYGITRCIASKEFQIFSMSILSSVPHCLKV